MARRCNVLLLVFLLAVLVPVAHRSGDAEGQAAWPGPGNTGVAAGAALAPLPEDAYYVIDVDGTVLEGVDLVGCVVVLADNVVVRNSRITCPATIPVVWLREGAGLTVSGNTLVGTGGAAAGVQGSAMRVEGNDISGTADGVKVGSDTVVTGNWIHDLWEGMTASGPTHNDGVQMQGGANVIISGNTITHQGPQGNSAVFFKSDSAPISDVTVSGNLLGGFGFTARCMQAVVGCRILDNTFERQGQRFGPTSIDAGASGVIECNVWDDGTPLAENTGPCEGGSALAPAATPETTTPLETAPPETTAPPKTTTPETTAPETTAPETTAPPATAPPTTVAPAITVPPTTVPPEPTAPTTAPSSTTPPTTAPAAGPPGTAADPRAVDLSVLGLTAADVAAIDSGTFGWSDLYLRGSDWRDPDVLRAFVALLRRVHHAAAPGLGPAGTPPTTGDDPAANDSFGVASTPDLVPGVTLPPATLPPTASSPRASSPRASSPWAPTAPGSSSTDDDPTAVVPHGPADVLPLPVLPDHSSAGADAPGPTASGEEGGTADAADRGDGTPSAPTTVTPSSRGSLPGAAAGDGTATPSPAAEVTRLSPRVTGGLVEPAIGPTDAPSGEEAARIWVEQARATVGSGGQLIDQSPTWLGSMLLGGSMASIVWIVLLGGGALGRRILRASSSRPRR